ncbi:MAG: hypothetical protein ACJA1A_001493, partial [Saprospiraceae bacterium]
YQLRVLEGPPFQARRLNVYGLFLMKLPFLLVV